LKKARKYVLFRTFYPGEKAEKDRFQGWRGGKGVFLAIQAPAVSINIFAGDVAFTVK